jgi:hypothetical protein
MAQGNVPKFLKLESGSIINLDHIVYVDESPKGRQAYLLGLTQPIVLTESDYEVIAQAADYSETIIWVGMNELTPLSTEKSLKLMTELIMHFVAHSIAHQQGTLNSFPLQAVFERIANIMNEINTAASVENAHDEEDVEDEDEDKENKKDV